MVRSTILLPVLLCAAVAVAAQDRPAGTAGTADNPAAQAPQQPTQKPAPAPEQKPAAPAPEKSAAAANKVTYSGCVKPGSAPETWILENAEVAKPGQTTAATSGGMKTTLNLTTKAGTDLKPHANHKIEVVGTIAPAAPAKPGGAPGQEARQEFTVESVKMVSTTCP
jgi:hypothetical protein